MAITPTTITCCRISDRFSAPKKRSVVTEKNAQAIVRAMNGPSWPIGGSLLFRLSMGFGPSGTWCWRPGMPCTPVQDLGLQRGGLLLAPAQVGAGLHVLAVDAGRRLRGDQ